MDIVFEKDSKWFFYDETWYPCGPFMSEFSAHKALIGYITIVFG